jgi:hypothetical protein
VWKELNEEEVKENEKRGEEVTEVKKERAEGRGDIEMEDSQRKMDRRKG